MCNKLKFDYVCEECGEGCEVVSVDFGIGPGEAWGQSFNDTNVQEVSKCCEANYRELDTSNHRDYMLAMGTDKHLQKDLFED